MRKFSFYISVLLILISSLACNLEKDVKVDLPPFQSKLVVEAYIEANKPPQLSLTQTQDYFSTPDSGILKSLFVNDADVSLTYMGKTYKMNFNPFPNLQELKYFNYNMKDTLPLKEGEPIYVQAKDKQGRMVTAEASWIKPVPIDSAVYYKSKDSGGYVVCYFRDKGPGADFYRFRLRRLSDSNYVKMDYASNDVLFNNQPSAFGSRPNLHQGDTVEVTLYTISKEYYDFYNSASSASQANGNPFAPPAVIESNVTGGTGIFTVLPYSRKIIICK